MVCCTTVHPHWNKDASWTAFCDVGYHGYRVITIAITHKLLEFIDQSINYTNPGYGL